MSVNDKWTEIAAAMQKVADFYIANWKKNKQNGKMKIACIK